MMKTLYISAIVAICALASAMSFPSAAKADHQYRYNPYQYAAQFQAANANPTNYYQTSYPTYSHSYPTYTYNYTPPVTYYYQPVVYTPTYTYLPTYYPTTYTVNNYYVPTYTYPTYAYQW